MKDENRKLLSDDLKEIEEQHRILNGQLRQEIIYLRKQLKEQEL